MKVINGELKNYNRRVDRSVTFKIDSLLEMSSSDIKEIDEHIGDIGLLVLTDTPTGNEVNIDIDEILKNLPENDTLAYKSPSKRLRNVLYCYCRQILKKQPTKEEFTEFYKNEYEKIIEHFKSKLDDNL